MLLLPVRTTQAMALAEQVLDLRRMKTVRKAVPASSSLNTLTD
jgi:hypothetical protein